MKLIFDSIKSGDNLPTKTNYHFNQMGGSIGRGENTSWQLLDNHNYISNQHLVIEFIDKVYFLKDVSTNGTFLKHPYTKLPKGQRIKINPNDIFILGDHEIQARYVDDKFFDDVSDILKNTQLEDQIIPDNDFLLEDAFDSIEEKSDINIKNYVDDSTKKNYATSEDQKDFVNQIDEQYFKIPEATNKAKKVHSDLSDVSLQRSINILEQKLGIDICSLDKIDRDYIFSEIGDIILNTLDGLSHSLHITKKVKDDLNVFKLEDDVTAVNPITLGTSASKLLQIKENNGMFGMAKLSDSLKQSFSDIDNHNITLHTCSKSIMKLALTKFSPKNLEYSFESKGQLKSFFTFKKVMIWKAYKRQFDHLSTDEDQSFHIIADEFSKEYNNIAYSIKLATKKNISKEVTGA